MSEPHTSESNCRFFIGASAASPTLVVKTENCLYICIYIYMYVCLIRAYSVYIHPAPFVRVVSHGHTPFRKRGKGSGNFFYSSLLPCTVECGTNHSAVFCHMSAVITTSIGNYKVYINCETTSSCFVSLLEIIMRP